MKIRNLLVVFGLMFFVNTQAQTVTWATDIAPIIYGNCTSCHRTGEIGPMPFQSYQQVKASGNMVAYTTRLKYMPPWKPDKTYSHFVGERGLTTVQIQKIQDWVATGMLRGDSTLEPPSPTFPIGSQLGTPDMVIRFAQSYAVQGNNIDDYRNFVFPINLPQDTVVVAAEFRPGNRSVVHHALMGYDTSGTAARKDAQAPGYGYPGSIGLATDVQNEYTGYVPGMTPVFYPSGTGKPLPKRSDLVVQVHYAPTSVATTDSSEIHLFFNKSRISRQVYTYTVSPYDLIGGPSAFVIPANQITTFRGIKNVPADISLVSIFPHAHLVGKSWLVYAVTPTQDTLKLIKIDDWDFNWQGGYVFPKLIKIPARSRIYIVAAYDNTTNNPNNPSNPPQTVSWGEGTRDEMYVCYINYLVYQQGDENILLGTKNFGFEPTDGGAKLYPVYPNPTNGQVSVGFGLMQTTKVTMQVMDAQGRVVKEIFSNKAYAPGRYSEDIDISGLPSGVYLLNFFGADFRKTQQIVKS